VFAQGLHGVCAACGMEPATVADPWGKDHAVKPDWQGYDERQRGHEREGFGACSFVIARTRSRRNSSNGRWAVLSRLPIST